MHHYEPVIVMNAPHDWMPFHDAELSMPVIGSPAPAATVVSLISLYKQSNQTSAAGNEVLFPPEGYRAGRSPLS
jgi:hypothetical protein